MAAFLLSLERDDIAPATVRGYRYDLRHFLAWRRTVQDGLLGNGFNVIAQGGWCRAR